MFVSYKNGNYIVALNLKDGTKIRYNNKDNFKPSRPESIDVKISNQCRHNCPFCHENSNENGKVASLHNMINFVKSLPPYIEIAVGGGNLMESFCHTKLFLNMLKEAKAVPSITVRQDDFMEYLDMLDEWKEDGLIYGIGVSLIDSSDNSFIKAVQERPYVIIHVIAGLLNTAQYVNLINKDLKLLILGYKTVRKGLAYFFNNDCFIKERINWLKTQYPYFKEDFAAVCFDNLALEQLEILNKISKEEKDLYFMGEDGTTTFYVDLVEGQFAQSSTSLNRIDIQNMDVQEMFDTIYNLNI